MKATIVATGTGFGEGPVWRAETRDILGTDVTHGRIWRADPGTGTVEDFADTAGSPNGAAPCADGGLVVTQNGGIDLLTIGIIGPDRFVPIRYVQPCLQRVHPDGTVTTLAGAGILQGGNDLVIDADGSVIFTEHPMQFVGELPNPYPPCSTARVTRYVPDGVARSDAKSLDDDDRFEILAEMNHYMNGIGLAPDGRILTVERFGLRWLDRDGSRSWLTEDVGIGDGFAFDVEGRVYLAMPVDGRLCVVDTDGAVVDDIVLPDGAQITNCCFGGDDLRTLFAADAGRGRLLAVESMPTPGLALHRFRG